MLVVLLRDMNNNKILVKTLENDLSINTRTSLYVLNMLSRGEEYLEQKLWRKSFTSYISDIHATFDKSVGYRGSICIEFDCVLRQFFYQLPQDNSLTCTQVVDLSTIVENTKNGSLKKLSGQIDYLTIIFDKSYIVNKKNICSELKIITNKYSK